MEWWNYLIIIAGAVLGYVVKWLMEKYSSVWAQRGLEFLDTVIIQSVITVNQIYVDERKKGMADGKWTEDEQINAKKMCFDWVWAQVPKKILELLTKWFGSKDKLEAYVSSGIEVAVKEAKEGSL